MINPNKMIKQRSLQQNRNRVSPTSLKALAAGICMLVVFVGCSGGEKSDAYGQFEAEEVTISAEGSGVLKEFIVEEGEHISQGQRVGIIDTVQLNLKKKELEAAIQSVHTNIDKLNAQAAVYKEQLETAKTNLERLQALRKGKAATQQQMDKAEGQVKVLQKQVHSVEVQKRSVYAELETMKIRIDQVEEQISRATITNPIDGIVLSSFAEPNELVSVGKPLYQIAQLNELILRVYISGAQLAELSLGEEVEVLIDKDAVANESLKGTVSWIASEAEFTPQMIQTKEERVTQVYAVKVRVSNPEGKLKIGMPGEINFMASGQIQ